MFDNIGDAVNRDNMTYKRKTASQAACDRRCSDQWNTQKSTPIQHPGPRWHLLTYKSVTLAKSLVAKTESSEPISIGMQTRNQRREVGPIEAYQHDDVALCEYTSDNMLFSNTPHELDPRAKPDLVHSITPCRNTRKEKFDVSDETEEPIASPASLVDIVDTLEDDRDKSDTSSLMSTWSCETLNWIELNWIELNLFPIT